MNTAGTPDSITDTFRDLTSSASFSFSNSNKYKILSSFEIGEEEMNDQLLNQPGGKVKDMHTHTNASSSSSSAFSSTLHSPHDDENEALNKPELKPTHIDESLDFENLESTMWRKVTTNAKILFIVA